VGAWLFGVWLLGASLVYAGNSRESADGASASQGMPRDGVATGASDGEANAGAPRGVEPGGFSPSGVASRAAGDYPFDGLSREVETGRVVCPDIELTDFPGEPVPMSPPARVAEPFREPLRQLERVVREQSLEIYGRLPSAILVAASYDCRSVSGKNQRLSEHALGNAIDIRGFRFDALEGAAPFEVLVDRHWQAAAGDARHRQFLHAVTDSLLRREVFRTLLGPAHPDHADHFHFDMAPHPYVNL
jgi:hypothetical protein